jgi:hypothetical protein
MWNEKAIEMLHDILYHPTMDISMTPWLETVNDTSKLIKASNLTTDNLINFRSPKVSHLDSYQMSIFGIRVSATDRYFSTGNWLRSSTTKEALARHKVELNVSNSTCDSGNMVTAGSILLKHPTYTQRMYFMMSIRRQIPINAPFFDIVVHKHTFNGLVSPHLAVKCGANHQTILSEILSIIMDGIKTTALYVGTQYIQTLTQEALEDLYDLHQKYVNSIQRLPLSPQVYNIDRQRNERTVSGDINRSTREWANSLKTQDGKPLQCDAENGGKDKKAYLLVPKHLLDKVRSEMNNYTNNIKTWQFRAQQPNGESQNTDEGRPREIYVPTAAVQRNIDFLKSMASVDIWRNAPSIRQPGQSDSHQYTVKPTMQGLSKQSFTQQTQACNTPSRPHQQQQPRTPLSDNLSNSRNMHTTTPRQSTPMGRHLDDNTITTANSNTTTINSAYATKFNELEQAIKASQSDFQQMNSRFDSMENQMLNTMTSCHENSKHILSMQKQMNSMQSNVQDIANQMRLLTTHLKSDLTTQSEGMYTDHQTQHMQSPQKKKPRQMEPEANLSLTPHRSSTNLEETYWHSNKQQTNQPTTKDVAVNPSADQTEDQYQETLFPGTAMQE